MASKSVKEKIKPDYPVVAVYAFDWAGSVFTNENFTEEEIQESIKPINAWIVGMLVEENDKYIVLSQSFFEDTENHRCPIAIAKCTIKERIDYK